jgi:hypothetical protein
MALCDGFAVCNQAAQARPRQMGDILLLSPEAADA